MADDETNADRVDSKPPESIVAINQSPESSVVMINQCNSGSVMINQCGGDNVTVNQSAPAGEEQAPKRHRSKETRRRRVKGLGGLQQEKTGYWTLRCTINGKRVSKSTGTKDRAEAEQFARRYLAPYVKDDAQRTYANIQAAVMTERQLEEMKADEGPQMKLSAMWSEYEATPLRKDLAKSTLGSKKYVLEQFLEYLHEFFPEVLEVRQLARYHTESYLSFLRKDHAASTYNNRLCVLREIYRTLMPKARAKVNPWDGFPLLPDDSHSRREFTIEELARLVDVASREGPEWKTLFGIAMYTGLRLGDCCKLTWSEVDLVRSIIQKIPEKTKKYRKGKPVTVPIHKVLADLLMQTPVEKRLGFVLPTLGYWATKVQHGMGRIHNRIGRILKNAGIVTSVEVEGRKWKAPEATFHSLRHTFVSMSANAGVPLHIVQAIVGHESTAMTRHYYHENVAALQQAVEAIPSISETGEVSPGEVAPPDIARMIPRYAPVNRHMLEAAPLQETPPQAPAEQIIEAESVEPAPEAAEPEPEPAPEPAPEPVPEPAPEPAEPEPEPAPVKAVPVDHLAIRRQARADVAAVASADAKKLGGWGEDGTPASPLPTLNRRQRNEWIGRCVRRWCLMHKTALLEGTSRLVGNGGYRFLQELWEKGVPMSIDDVMDALDVYLQAKG